MTTEDTLHDSIYTKFYNSQNCTLHKVVTGVGKGWEGTQGTLWGDGNVLHLSKCVGNKVHICQNLW